MEIEKYIITYKIGNDIPINPDWIRSKLQAAVKELQAEIDKKPLNGQHVLEFETSSKLQAWQPVPEMIGWSLSSFNDFPLDKFVKSFLVLVLMKRDNVFNEARASANNGRKYDRQKYTENKSL